MAAFTNIAAYKFVPLTNVGPLRERLLTLCKGWQLRGTILLSPEGINLFVAGAAEAVDLLLKELRSWPGLASLEVKLSASEYQPFDRMRIRIKNEIIAFGVEGIEPGHRTSPKLPPRKLKEWLDEGRPLVLLDTRNNYEVKLGSFKNARAIGVDHFRDFPSAVRKLPEDLKDQPIVMFCTGGIRCEKAGPFMEHEGFKNIFQLEGGILKYFEDCGGAHYEGECFVFDQRVGVDPKLRETGSTQCFSCLALLTEEQQTDPRYVPGKSCSYCFKTAAENMAASIAYRHELIRKAVTPLPGRESRDNFKPINVPQECDGKTLLDAFASLVKHLPVSELEREFSLDRVSNTNHEQVAADHRVRAGERYLHKFPNVIEPDVDGRVEILHEDEALVVINKPAPLPMHAGGRFYRNTLQYILDVAYHPERPRPAHRLDANTTGVLLMTRTRFFAGRLQPQFARGQVKKLYLVRVQGQAKDDAFDCDAPISSESSELGSREVDFKSGRSARTEFRVLRRDADGTTLMEARPLTGRTNQIRVHLWHLGLPVCGDPVYLPGNTLGDTQTLSLSDPPLCLHAWRIAFLHPLTQEPVEFTAPPPSWTILQGSTESP